MDRLKDTIGFNVVTDCLNAYLDNTKALLDNGFITLEDCGRLQEDMVCKLIILLVEGGEYGEN